MDSARAASGIGQASGKQTAQNDSPEQLLDVFKAAALSVTKLYKTSAALESKARTNGYQECLDDLLHFLDKGNMGLGDGEGWRIRRWATERLDGREGFQSNDSEDEVEKAERTASPEITRTSTEPQVATQPRMRADSPAPAPTTTSIVEEHTRIVVPSQDSFNFQSSHPYPNIATLDLSDSRSHDGTSLSASRSAKARLNAGSSRSGARGSSVLGRGAGSKRRMDFDDFFGGCLGGKDPFGGGGKRSRHT